MSNKKSGTLTGFKIAIIGMVGRFPGANHIDEFWDNLINGRETVSFFSDEELSKAGVNHGESEDPNNVKAFGILDNIENFDPDFFGYSPADARQMDPQMRLFHEYAWTALEDAGYDPGTYSGLIGLYAGAADNYYWQQMSLLSALESTSEHFPAGTLSNKDYLSTRTSFKLNLKGPSSTIFNACSTSLIAAHLACQALLSGDCDMALAGGVALSLPQKKTYHYQEGMIYSSDGHCRTFDAKANGSVFGNGIAVVVLKRIKEAIKDGDHIYAVIKGTAINNDGSRKIGYTAPSIEGQAEVIRTALQMAEVDPESICFIEAHGTATPLGDTIEIEALKRAFNTDKKGFCAIGTVKTNLGHLDAAAGLTGLIKTVLALKYKQIPPSIHCQSPNPEIDFENSPFYVNTRLREWKNDKYPLRAGVSAFGIGGTNAHVILEEAPGQSAERKAQRAGRAYQLILLSAKTETALEKMTENLAEYFKKNLLNRANHENPTNPGLTLADAAYTLQVGRKVFNHRKMLICSTVNEAIEKLSSTDTGKVHTFCPGPEEKRIVFMFSGLGAQYVNMGRELYETESLFRRDMDRCFEILQPLIGFDIKEILYPGERKAQSAERNAIDQTDIAQLAIFIFEYALAQLVMKWGIPPQALIGYSFGEYAAACIAGVFSLEDALKLVVSRGELIKKTPPGLMLSVPLAKETLIPLLPGDLCLAIDNGPSCVISGPPGAIAKFENQLKQEKIVSMLLQGSSAIHSALIEPILEEFKKKINQVVLNEPHIPFISNVTGKWITPGEATDPGYWVRQLRETVRFASGFNQLVENVPNAIFVEIGPGRDLAVLAQRHIKEGTPAQVVNLIRPAQRKVPDIEYLMGKIGTLWLYGQTVDWPVFYREENRQRISLPTYSFDYQRHWFDKVSQPETPGSYPQPIKKPEVADWFYLPQWNRCMCPTRTPLEIAGWLLFMDSCGIGDCLLNTWLKENPYVVIVRKGKNFEKIDPKEYVMNPAHPEDYSALLRNIKTIDLSRGFFQVIHLWSISQLQAKGRGKEESEVEIVKRDLEMGFYSLVYLAHAVEEQAINAQLYFTVVSNNMQEVVNEKPLFPGKMTLLGPVKVIPQEYHNIRTRSIDIVLPPLGSGEEEKLLRQLWVEISSETVDTIIAFRGSHRWIQSFEPVYLPKAPPEIPVLKEGGVYLISGGLGDIGYLLAKHLARKVNARLVLTGRTPIPAVEQWEEWCITHDEQDPVTRKIRKVRELEKLGAKVLAMSADVSKPDQMQTVVERTEQVFGPINGVIHAAGILEEAAFRYIGNMDRDQCEKQFSPKIYGPLVLEKVFKNRKPGFFLLMSSLSSILGGLGFTAYSAANLFMDGFAQQREQEGPIPWISVNWDNWQLRENPGQTPAWGGEQVQLSMTPEEGVDAFERVLCPEGMRRIVHSTGDLQARISRWIKLEALRELEGPKGEVVKSETLAPRPNLSRPYETPVNKIQQKLAEIWQQLFGITEIGIQDDFFELGGDSLKAITVTSRIHKELNAQIPVREFFNHPTIQELSGYINLTETSTYSPIKPAEEKEYYPLSSAQQRFYILQQMGPGIKAYNLTLIKKLEVQPDGERVRKAFQQLINRHESLRTSFESIKGEIVQRIHQNIDFTIEYIEAPTSEPGNVIANFVKCFDLAQAPLMRLGFIKLGEREHIIVLDMHHIITDGMSMDVFFGEFMACYASRELSPLALQYRDFCQWQYDMLVSGKLKKQEKYWLEEFSGKLPVLNMPTDYQRPPVQSFEGDIITFHLDRELTRKLNQLIKETGTTLFMMLLALYNILLSKYTGQDDIIIGTTTAGRNQLELEHIIGLFIETLATRNYPEDDKTFEEFLEEVKTNTLNTFENQAYPFRELVKHVWNENDLSRNPLFDAMLIVQNFTIAEDNPGITDLRAIPYEGAVPKRSKVDISIEAREMENGISFFLEYCTKLFKKETMEYLIHFFKKIAITVVDNKKIKLKNIRPSYDFMEAISGDYDESESEFEF